jgi:hypothetical protein
MAMPASAFLALLDALELALRTPSPRPGVVVRRAHVPPMAREQGALVNLRILRSSAQRGMLTTARVQWVTDVAVDCVVRHAAAGGAPGSADAVAAVDELLQSVYARLCQHPGSVQQHMGRPIALMPDGDISWDIDEAATGAVAATLRLRVHHNTQGASLAP